MKLGLAKPKPQPVDHNNFMFKQSAPYLFDKFQTFNFRSGGPKENPLMRTLTPNHSRSVSRDVGPLHQPSRHNELSSASQKIAINQQQVLLTSHQNLASQRAGHNESLSKGGNPSDPHQAFDFNATTTPGRTNTNNQILQQATSNLPNFSRTAPQSFREYQFAKDSPSQIHESKVNISIDMISNDQSRIQKPALLQLRSGSRDNSKTDLHFRQDLPVITAYKLPQTQVPGNLPLDSDTKFNIETSNMTTPRPEHILITGKPSGTGTGGIAETTQQNTRKIASSVAYPQHRIQLDGIEGPLTKTMPSVLIASPSRGQLVLPSSYNRSPLAHQYTRSMSQTSTSAYNAPNSLPQPVLFKPSGVALPIESQAKIDVRTENTM